MAPAPRLREVTAAPPEAGDAFFRRHCRRVARLAFRLVGKDGDVDDLVQDVFLAAYRGLPPGLSDEDSWRWMARVTVRLAGRRLRRRRVATFLGFGDDGPDELVAGPAVSPEVAATVAQLYRRLDGIPVGERLAWTLRHIENEPLDEVARLCGCSLATAKRRIAAARDRLVEGT